MAYAAVQWVNHSSVMGTGTSGLKRCYGRKVSHHRFIGLDRVVCDRFHHGAHLIEVDALSLVTDLMSAVSWGVDCPKAEVMLRARVKEVVVKKYFIVVRIYRNSEMVPLQKGCSSGVSSQGYSRISMV